MVFAINPGAKFAAFQAAAMGNTTTTNPSSSAASPTATASSTPPSSTSQDHKIIVGGTTLTFEPSNITAQPGDTITFEFHQKNHTVTQSSFAKPCQALASGSTSGQVGFDSGLYVLFPFSFFHAGRSRRTIRFSMAVSPNATTFPTWTVQVNDTSPIWAYCRQIGHCAGGMVFAANANESSANTFEAFQESAKQTGNGSNPTGSSAGKNGAGAVRLGGTGMIAVGLAALLLGLTL
jgi:plastocyanin